MIRHWLSRSVDDEEEKYETDKDSDEGYEYLSNGLSTQVLLQPLGTTEAEAWSVASIQKHQEEWWVFS